MDHSTSQLNLLKLQHQQISNQIIQLELHLSTLSQIDNDSEEVLNNISNIEESIHKLKQQKIAIEGELKQSTEISNVFTNKIEIPDLNNEENTINWKIVFNAFPNKVDGSNKQEFKAAWQIIKE